LQATEKAGEVRSLSDGDLNARDIGKCLDRHGEFLLASGENGRTANFEN
jgi:hypothetical protein